MTTFNNFVDFLQEAINLSEKEFFERYQTSIYATLKGSEKESRDKFADLVNSIVMGSHNYKQRY